MHFIEVVSIPNQILVEQC